MLPIDVRLARADHVDELVDVELRALVHARHKDFDLAARLTHPLERAARLKRGVMYSSHVAHNVQLTPYHVAYDRRSADQWHPHVDANTCLHSSS